MKLYTCCNESEANIKCINKVNLMLKDYSCQEYLEFMEEAKQYYIKEYHDWYQTDMSDSDSGSTTKYFTINQTNLVVKNGKFHGVLVSANDYFPKYFLVSFAQKRYYHDFDGGYNSNSFEWTFEKYDLNESTLNFLSKYLLIVEKTSYEISESDKKLSSYNRLIVGFMPKQFIVENDKVVGFKYNELLFTLNKPESFIQKSEEIEKYPYETYQKYTIHSLIEVNEEHLEKNVFNVSYNDFKENNYKIYTKL